MARSWPIEVVVLLIFLAATVDCARTSVSTGTPKNTTQQPVVTTTKKIACGDRWTNYSTSFFSFCKCTQPCSGNDAMKKCEEKQAELAKCNSRELENFFKRSLNTPYYILLGGNDRVKEGTWRWPDGSLLNESYTNWYTGEPSGGARMNCLDWYYYKDKWFDWPCDDPYPAHITGFVCEKKTSVRSRNTTRLM